MAAQFRSCGQRDHDPGGERIQLRGDVPASDLPAELHLMAAYARDPGFRDEAKAKIASMAPMIADQIDGDSAAVFQRRVQHALVGSRYQELPERSDLLATTGEELPGLLRSPLAMAADVAIVGDVSVEDAIRAMAESLVTGGLRSVQHAVKEAARPQVTVQSDRIVDSQLGSGDVWLDLYWRLPDKNTAPRAEPAAAVAAALLEGRLLHASATSAGASNPPTARAVFVPDLRGGSFLGIASLLPSAAAFAVSALMRSFWMGLRLRPVCTKRVILLPFGKQPQPAKQWTRMVSRPWRIERLGS